MRGMVRYGDTSIAERAEVEIRFLCASSTTIVTDTNRKGQAWALLRLKKNF